MAFPICNLGMRLSHTAQVVPDHTPHIIVREDDNFFGLLQSRIHEMWSLAVGSTLEHRPRYSLCRMPPSSMLNALPVMAFLGR